MKLERGIAELSWRIEGDARVSERLMPGTDTEKLAESTTHSVNVEFTYSQDEDVTAHHGVAMGMSAYHIENPDTGRCFDCQMDVIFERDELAMLRDFLTLLLEHSR